MSANHPQRIVSLVPGGTEILFALGAGDQIVGVSHECDFPAAARSRPVLTAATLPAHLTAAEIDQAVGAQIASGSLYTLDEAAIAHLAPELIVTQDLCPVCAVSADQVGALQPCPEVISLHPHTLADLFADIEALGHRLGRPGAAAQLQANLHARLQSVARRVAGRPRPRVLALEWLDPLFTAGHWVPEMIAAAGGQDIVAAPGDPSCRLSWEQLATLDPDLILAMPCGFDAAAAAAQLVAQTNPIWTALRAVGDGAVHALDANALFSRPGPRLVDGVELLAGLFHPNSEA